MPLTYKPKPMPGKAAKPAAVIKPKPARIIKPKAKEIIRPQHEPEVSKPAKIRQVSKSKYETMDALDQLDSDSDTQEFMDLLRDIAKSESHVIKDPRLDMRELPKAKNSYEWLSGRRFLSYGPFARQCEIIGKLNLDVCPICTPEFYDDYHDHKKSHLDYPHDFQYFENGVCPHCKYTRHDAVMDGELADKYMLVGVAGQRCVERTTFVATLAGPMPVVSLRTKLKGNSGLALTPKGQYSVSNFFNQGRDLIFRVTTQSGRYIDVNARHRLYIVGKGYSNLESGGKTPTYKRGDLLQVSSIPKQRQFSLFEEPEMSHISYIDLGKKFSKVIAGKFAKGKLNNIAKLSPDKIRQQLGTTGWPSDFQPQNKYKIENVYIGDITAPIGEDNSWLWGEHNFKARDYFFTGLGDYSVTNDIVYANIPWVWINAFMAWLDEFGVSAKQIRPMDPTDGRCLLQLNALEMYDAEMPIEYLFGRGTLEFFAKLPKSERHEIVPMQIAKYFGDMLSDVLKLFGPNKKTQISPPAMELLSPQWVDAMERVDIFRTTALNGAMRADLTAEACTALLKIKEFILANNIKENKTRAAIDQFIGEISGIHSENFSPIVSIQNVGSAQVYDIEVDQVHCFYGNGIHSHNSSKSITASMGIGYQSHRLFHIGDTAAYYGLLPGTVLSCVLTATTIEQVKKNMFIPGIQHVFKDTPWFKEFNSWLDEKGREMGTELYKHQETGIFYKLGSLSILCKSPDRRTIRGFTAYATAVDELGHFDDDGDKVRAGGLEVQSALMTAMQNVLGEANLMRERGMNDVVFPCNYSISSPMSETDPIMTLRKRHKNDEGVLSFRYPTWKFNPKLTEAMLRKTSDPENFDRDIGCQPPRTAGNFISKVDTLKSMLGDRGNGSHINRREFVNPNTGQIFTTGQLGVKWKAPNAQTILSIDAGEKFNSFAFNVGHIDPEDERSFITDVMGEVQPLHDRPIHFSSIVENVIGPLIEHYGVKVLATDRWQNIKLSQDIADEFGIETYTYSLKMPDFISWRGDVIDDFVLVPREEMELEEAVSVTDITKFVGMPVAHFFQQCMSVRDTGKNLEKGKGFTDDLFRAHVLGWRLAQEEEVRELIMAPADQEAPQALVAMGMGAVNAKKPQAANDEENEDEAMIVSMSMGSASKKR